MSIQKCQFELNINADGYESKARGTPMFPCGAYWWDLNDSNTKKIPWHWHEEIEVLVAGAGALQLHINGELYSLRAGEGAFINSNVLHSICGADEPDCMINSLVFSASLLSGSAESVFEQRYVRPLLNCRSLPFVLFRCDAEWTRQAARCIRDAYEAYAEEKNGYELIVREKLSYMWYLLVTNKQPVMEQQYVNEDKDTARLKEMINYLHQHYAEKINLQQVAATVNISERECLRCFNKIIGTTPMKYLTRYRISVAAGLLANSDMNVTEVCRLTGFESPSHFALTFRKMVEMTPREYRKFTSAV